MASKKYPSSSRLLNKSFASLLPENSTSSISSNISSNASSLRKATMKKFSSLLSLNPSMHSIKKRTSSGGSSIKRRSTVVTKSDKISKCILDFYKKNSDVYGDNKIKPDQEKRKKLIEKIKQEKIEAAKLGKSKHSPIEIVLDKQEKDEFILFLRNFKLLTGKAPSVSAIPYLIKVFNHCYDKNYPVLDLSTIKSKSESGMFKMYQKLINEAM
jgi:hypothetical protein